jgi:hypothetical protein
MTTQEALDAIANKHGHADWALAKYRLGEKHLDVLIKEAMQLYATSQLDDVKKYYSPITECRY